MFLPHSDKEVNEILQNLGLSSLEDLFSHIDPSLLEPPKNLPEEETGIIEESLETLPEEEIRYEEKER